MYYISQAFILGILVGVFLAWVTQIINKRTRNYFLLFSPTIIVLFFNTVIYIYLEYNHDKIDLGFGVLFVLFVTFPLYVAAIVNIIWTIRLIIKNIRKRMGRIS